MIIAQYEKLLDKIHKPVFKPEEIYPGIYATVCNHVGYYRVDSAVYRDSARMQLSNALLRMKKNHSIKNFSVDPNWVDITIVWSNGEETKITL